MSDEWRVAGGEAGVHEDPENERDDEALTGPDGQLAFGVGELVLRVPIMGDEADGSGENQEGDGQDEKDAENGRGEDDDGGY